MTKATIKDDSHTDYQTCKQQAEAGMQEGVWIKRFAERFVPLKDRKMHSDLPREAIDHISEGKKYLSYRGIPMAKDPLDKVLYETLFFEIKPRTVIELGAYAGGSALWMADTLDSYGVDAHVYSLDIDLGLVFADARQRSDVTFIEGDCHQIQECLPPELLSDCAHPWVVIDDAHVAVDKVYQYLHEHGMRQGDYLIVEDINPWIPGTFGTDESGGQDWGDWKWQEIQQFFQRHEDEYRVDRYYTDFFGYNGTWNWNGFLKRV